MVVVFFFLFSVGEHNWFHTQMIFVLFVLVFEFNLHDQSAALPRPSLNSCLKWAPRCHLLHTVYIYERLIRPVLMR